MQAGASISDLPHALADHEELRERLAGRRPAVLLDYDGTLTPIVDPEIGGIADWTETPRVLASVRDRRVRGNAVLTLP